VLKKFLTLCLILPLLAACAGAIPGNQQGYAGINRAEIEFDEAGKPEYALIVGGKENDSVSLNVKTPDGLEVQYTASGSKAFDGQAVRGAVEQAISGDVRDAAPGIIENVMDALKGVWGPLNVAP
jgi:hypothetical protein